ncbi:MAG: S-methyl-5'-thioinosine phosphorylase [Gammaproteobacteria bacterium]|nr:S-methyl-5'-thioinosine phosphorylase [Gammaproteobacteria bacterium]
MSELAVIGGTGATSLEGLKIERRQVVHTPYGQPSGPVVYGDYNGKPMMFLARHGHAHSIPPHQVNYRANIWCLKHVGAKNIIAIAAVGSIHPDMQPEDLVIPHQLIDYTWSRKHTFFEGGLGSVTHVDFTEPYCSRLREHLVQAAAQTDSTVYTRGVYGAVQGPRLETAAEIDRMEKDGCDVVGMTGMPEASLARELNLCYATCAVVANKAAGRGSPKITLEEIRACLENGVDKVRQLLSLVIPMID